MEEQHPYTPAAPLAAAPEAPAGLSDELREQIGTYARYARTALQLGRPREYSRSCALFAEVTTPDAVLALLEEATDLRRELTEARAAHAAAVAKLAQEGEQEAELLQRDEEARGIRKCLKALHDDLFSVTNGMNATQVAREVRINLSDLLARTAAPVTGEAQSLPAAGAGKEGGAAK